MRTRWMLVVMLCAGFVLQLHAQTADTSATSGGNADAAYGVETVIKLLSMALGSWLFAMWNKTKPLLDGIPDPLKGIAVTILVTLLGMAGTLLHVAVGKETADWNASFFMSLASGLGTWAIGHIAISSHKAKALASKTPTRSV